MKNTTATLLLICMLSAGNALCQTKFDTSEVMHCSVKYCCQYKIEKNWEI